MNQMILRDIFHIVIIIKKNLPYSILSQCAAIRLSARDNRTSSSWLRVQTDEDDTYHRDVKTVETTCVFGRNSAEFTSEGCVETSDSLRRERNDLRGYVTCAIAAIV